MAIGKAIAVASASAPTSNQPLAENRFLIEFLSAVLPVAVNALVCSSAGRATVVGPA
jgi:hypothetical protein